MSGSTESSICEGSPERRPYEVPRMARVSLEADQVLFVGCKTPSGLPAVGLPGCGIPACGAQGS